MGSGFGWVGFGFWVRMWDKNLGLGSRPKHIIMGRVSGLGAMKGYKVGIRIQE